MDQYAILVTDARADFAGAAWSFRSFREILSVPVTGRGIMRMDASMIRIRLERIRVRTNEGVYGTRLIGEKDGMEFWRIAIFIVIGIVWTLNREYVLHGNFIFPSLCRNRVHREEDRKIKLEHGFIYIFRLFVKGFIASFRVWKIFGVSNGRGIISVSTGGYRAAIGIVNTPALTRRENRASIGRRVFHA